MQNQKTEKKFTKIQQSSFKLLLSEDEPEDEVQKDFKTIVSSFNAYRMGLILSNSAWDGYVKTNVISPFLYTYGMIFKSIYDIFAKSNQHHTAP